MRTRSLDTSTEVVGNKNKMILKTVWTIISIEFLDAIAVIAVIIVIVVRQTLDSNVVDTDKTH